MTFSENIKQTRQRLFYSQEAFAKELNVNLTTVSRWETGKSKPNMSTMRQIKEFCTKYNADYEPLESSWLLIKRNKEEIGELICQVESPARASTIL